jgi:hypothetical protein
MLALYTALRRRARPSRRSLAAGRRLRRRDCSCVGTGVQLPAAVAAGFSATEFFVLTLHKCVLVTVHAVYSQTLPAAQPDFEA